MVCHSGVGLVPVIDGTEHHFSAGGLYNGLILGVDDETRTYWDHITGEAVHGPLVGERLEMFSIRLTNVPAALELWPDITISRSQPGLKGRVMSYLMTRRATTRDGFFPPGFRKTMGASDDRLHEHTHGLGIIEGDVRRFYVKEEIGEGIVDEVGGRRVHVRVNEIDQAPYATWCDETEPPKQLYTRWYGFAFTFPGCEIYGR